MRTYNLTQAQVPGSYAGSIQSVDIDLLVNRAHQESVVHFCGSQAQFCYTRLVLLIV